MTMRTLACLALTLLLGLPLSAAPAELAKRTLTIHGQQLVVEVASTPETRATGLMRRFSLQTDHGMLFVFEMPQALAFWMKDTYIPLSIAFVDARGRIVEHRGHASAGRIDPLVQGPRALCDRDAAGLVFRQGDRCGRRRRGVGRSRSLNACHF